MVDEVTGGNGHMVLSFRRGVWTSCRTVPHRKMGRRKAEKNSRGEERRCVAVPQEEACMTQTCRLSFNQEERGREKRGRGRHAGDRGEWEHTHSCNLITESSRLLPSAFKGYGHSYTQIWNQETDINTDRGRAHTQTHTHTHLYKSVQRACRHLKHVFNHTLVNKRAAQWPDSIGNLQATLVFNYISCLVL